MAATHPITYDAYWHLLVARQETAAGFAREWRTTAHPPLYYWLLGSLTSVVRGRVFDRSISLLAGAATVFAAGRIAMTLTSNPAISLLTAIAFALLPAASTA